METIKKAVIFDFNGTLFLDNDKHVKAWGEIARELRGKPITEEELHAHCNGVPNHMIIRYLYGKEDPQIEAKYSKKKEEIYRKLCKEDVKNFHLIQGAERLFNELKENNIPFTIASASIKDNIDFFVESFHLDEWIDPNKICYDDGSYPNKTAMLKKACEILGTAPEDTTIIEDSLSGINSANTAGIKDIRIINSANEKEAYSKLDNVYEVVENMDEITR